MSEAVVPRWEWRTFGGRLGAAEAALAAHVAAEPAVSDETYVLVPDGDASVKVRDGLLDVKLPERVADGLEQWRPVLKAAFPLSAEQAAVAAGALGVPAAAGGAAGVGALLGGTARAVAVHKERRRGTFGGCMVELTEVRTEAAASRTIAVEATDPALVSAAVLELGLAGRPNVCMARGLKALEGIGARRFAVLDCGTNSVKFHVGERAADGSWRTVADRAEVTRLGEGLDDAGELQPEPMERTAAAIAAMAEEARAAGAESLAAVGTAGLRIARNSAAFLALVRERAGVDVEVIPGEEEARLAYLAVVAGLDLGDGPVVVFDTGGGSSQFTFGRGREVDERFSVDVGAARFTERFGLDRPVPDDVLAEALAAIAADLSRLDGRTPPDALVGMGGAVTNLTAVSQGLAEYDPDAIQGAVLGRAEVERQIELYRTRTADERRAIPGLQPKRAEVILAGACVVRTVLDKLGRDALTVSDRGLRHGLVVERFPLPPLHPFAASA